MAKYPDYVIRHIEENSGSLGDVPLVFYSISGPGLKLKVPYELTVDVNKKIK